MADGVLQDKVVLVNGAGRGIGAEIAKHRAQMAMQKAQRAAQGKQPSNQKKERD